MCEFSFTNESLGDSKETLPRMEENTANMTLGRQTTTDGTHVEVSMPPVASAPLPTLTLTRTRTLTSTRPTTTTRTTPDSLDWGMEGGAAPEPVLVDSSSGSGKRKRDQSERRVDNSLDWLPANAREIIWGATSKGHGFTERPLISASRIQEVGDQLVAMLTSLLTFLDPDRLAAVKKTIIEKYLEAGYSVLLVANLGVHADAGEIESMEEHLTQLKMEADQHQDGCLEWVIAKSPLPPTAGRGRWCAIQAAIQTLSLAGLEDAWIVLTDDRRFIGLAGKKAKTCQSLTDALEIDRYRKLFGDHKPSTMAEVIGKTLDTTHGKPNGCVALMASRRWAFCKNREAWKKKISELDPHGVLVQVSVWSLKVAKQLVQHVNSGPDGLRSLVAISAAIGEDYAQECILRKLGVLIKLSFDARNSTDSKIGGKNITLARGFHRRPSDDNRATISDASLRHSCIALSGIATSEECENRPRWQFDPDKQILSFPELREKASSWENDKEQGFESHWKVMAVGILVGLLELSWCPITQGWLLEQNIGRSLSHVGREFRHGPHLDIDIHGVFETFPHTDLRVRTGHDWESIGPGSGGGFSSLGEKLRLIQNGIQADRSICRCAGKRLRPSNPPHSGPSSTSDSQETIQVALSQGGGAADDSTDDGEEDQEMHIG